MKKQKISRKLFGSSLAAAAFLAWAGAGTCSAYMDMAAMLDEGITYESAAPQQGFAATHDSRADLVAEMAEGIVYEESVVAEGEVVIRLDHRQAVQGMEACLCEDPVALAVEGQLAQ
ncbi:MAG: hypothetical protein C4531_02425 [Desulfurivibrio sp.]|jgi:hypothetical protein|nr:MAG: hypothetical protein C4531_02425 [Desulfurivibrio sp.]